LAYPCKAHIVVHGAQKAILPAGDEGPFSPLSARLTVSSLSSASHGLAAVGASFPT